MIPAELIKKVRRIEIRTSHIVNDALAGKYHSAFKGRGMEFEEVRQYQIGDDIRTIDWNVSARMNDPHVKVFHEERELTVMLLVDLSRSQQFGTEEQFKRELVAELSATLAFSAIKNNDKVGLICFTDQIEKFVPPRKGPKHVLRVIRELLAIEPKGRGTDLSLALDYLNRIQKRKAVVFLISDFQDVAYETPLKIARRRHDLIPVIISDRHEQELPNVGLIELKDNETGQQIVVDTSSKTVRDRFQEMARKHKEHRDHWLRSNRMDGIHLHTGEQLVEPLARYFKRREARLER